MKYGVGDILVRDVGSSPIYRKIIKVVGNTYWMDLCTDRGVQKGSALFDCGPGYLDKIYTHHKKAFYNYYPYGI